VCDLAIATYRSQATCQHGVATRDRIEVLQICESAPECTELPALPDVAHKNPSAGREARGAEALLCRRKSNVCDQYSVIKSSPCAQAAGATRDDCEFLSGVAALDQRTAWIGAANELSSAREDETQPKIPP